MTARLFRLGARVALAVPVAALLACSSPERPSAAPEVVAVGRGFVPYTGFGWEMTVKSDLTVVDLNARDRLPSVECVSTVTAAQWSTLLTLVENARFFELRDVYTSDPSLPIAYFTRVTRTDAKKTIYVLVGQPTALLELDGHLDGLRKSLHWTGKAGDPDAQAFCNGRVFIKDTN